MVSKPRRQQLIIEVIASRRIMRQEELVALLKVQGIIVTQATLSRDLRDLAVFKGPLGYVYGSGQAPPIAANAAALEAAVKMYLVTATLAGNILVCRTKPGHAPPLASQLDVAKPSGMAGTIAGDDTVFIAVESMGRAKTLLRNLRAMLDAS